MIIFIIIISCAISTAFCTEVVCGDTYRYSYDFQYTITSPNYPNNYPDDTECVYYLQGDITTACEQEFHLQFLDFNLKSSNNCNEDYLQVGNRYMFCGSTAGLQKFYGKNNTLTVVFHSDEEDNAKGFKILVTAIPCTLEFNPLKNYPYEDNDRKNKSEFELNNIASNAYRREIRDDSNHKTSNRFFISLNNSTNPTTFQFHKQNSSIRQPQIDFTLKKNSIVDSLYFPSPLNDLGIPVSKATPHMSPQVISYFFVPPTEINMTTRNNFTKIIKDKIFHAATPLSNEFSPLSFSSATKPTSTDKKSSFERIKKLSVVPLIGASGKTSLNIANYDLQNANDCNQNSQITQRINDNVAVPFSEGLKYNLLQENEFEETGRILHSIPNIIYDPRYGFVDANNYPTGHYNPPQSYSGYYFNISPNVNPTIAISNGGKYNPSDYYLNYSNNGYYSGFKPIMSNYNSGYNSIIPNYNFKYNSGYNPWYYYNSNSYNPSINGNYYSSNGNFWSNGFNGQNVECCKIQSSRRFLLVSPTYPENTLSSNNYLCSYTITKASADVCRLRLNFKFFNYGTEDLQCKYGYVEIDGRRYCGCETGRSVLVSFSNHIVKSIFVSYAGYPKTKFSGFVIDVVQESCISYSSYQPYISHSSYPTNPIYTGNLQRRRDELNPILGTSKFTNSQNSSVYNYIRFKRNLGYSYFTPSIQFLNNDKKLNSAIIENNVHEKFLGGSCQTRVFLDWILVAKETILRNARCERFEISGINRKSYLLPPVNNGVINSIPTACEEFDNSQGVVTSPLFPNNYPPNVQKCYRFKEVPNFCKLDIHMQEFELDPSQGCTKDYLSFNKDHTKFCGNSLNNFKKIFNLTRTNPLEVYFVSNSNGANRGFKMAFSRLPCKVSANF